MNATRAVLLLCLLATRVPAALAIDKITPGAPLPDFSLPLLNGGTPLRLSSSLGPKATVVVFWSTWSPRSAEVLSDMQIFYKKHGKGDLQVVAVNVEHETWNPEDAPRIREYLAGEGVTYPVVLDTDLAVYELHGFTSVPSSILADASGTVVEVLPGYPESQRVDFLRKALELLGIEEPKPPDRSPDPAPGPGTYAPEGKAVKLFNFGRGLLKKGRREDALGAFRAALKEDPTYLAARHALADALDAAGRTEEATQERRKADELSGSAPR